MVQRHDDVLGLLPGFYTGQQLGLRLQGSVHLWLWHTMEEEEFSKKPKLRRGGASVDTVNHT